SRLVGDLSSAFGTRDQGHDDHLFEPSQRSRSSSDEARRAQAISGSRPRRSDPCAWCMLAVAPGYAPKSAGRLELEGQRRATRSINLFERPTEGFDGEFHVGPLHASPPAAANSTNPPDAGS